LEGVSGRFCQFNNTNSRKGIYDFFRNKKDAEKNSREFLKNKMVNFPWEVLIESAEN